MSKMSDLYLTVTEYVEQGDNAYRIASVLNVPVEWVLEIEKEVRQVEASKAVEESDFCLG